MAESKLMMSTQPHGSLHAPPAHLATLGLSINELRAKAIIIYICISNKQKSNIAESSQLATLQKHPFRNFTLTGSPLPHSLTSVLCAQLLALFAPSPTTAGCA
jgi:hypothetical protein